MDERVARLRTPEECEQFIQNVKDRLPELVNEAKRHSVELRALEYGAEEEVEREALEAVYAYERALMEQKGKRIRATRTWQMIDRWGIIEAIERVVRRPDDSTGYRALLEMGMEDKAFEAVVLRHPESFSEEAIDCSKKRLDSWKAHPPEATGAGT